MGVGGWLEDNTYPDLDGKYEGGKFKPKIGPALSFASRPAPETTDSWFARAWRANVLGNDQAIGSSGPKLTIPRPGRRPQEQQPAPRHIPRQRENVPPIPRPRPAPEPRPYRPVPVLEPEPEPYRPRPRQHPEPRPRRPDDGRHHEERTMDELARKLNLEQYLRAVMEYTLGKVWNDDEIPYGKKMEFTGYMAEMTMEHGIDAVLQNASLQTYLDSNGNPLVVLDLLLAASRLPPGSNEFKDYVGRVIQDLYKGERNAAK